MNSIFQAAAAQVAQSLGYNVAPVGVPTAAAYGDTGGTGGLFCWVDD